jgi:hypothetical protein
VRPFCRAARLTNRSYSLLLERRITDFGADVAFAQISIKLQEHYGIEVPISSAQAITQKHARAIEKIQQGELQSELSQAPGVKCLIGQMDGSMIPIMTLSPTPAQDQAVDRRKLRQVGWQEARLSLVHPMGSRTPIFGATLGSPLAAGDQWLDCAIRSGMGQDTQVHCLGDGAPWINEQRERVFGMQSHYLIDLCHVCDYLVGASASVAPQNPTGWAQEQKQRLKTNQSSKVLKSLEPYLESESVGSLAAPVRTCHRYISNRPGQFNYQEALAAGLPIGSGEIESAHRYVIQQRLKIAGAWWKPSNAQAMLALRTNRANRNWDDYWKNRNPIPEQHF